MIQKELRHSDPPKQVAATARVPGGGREANRPYSSAPAREAATSAAAAAVAPSSQLWLGIRDPRIVRVSRALGGKDRHSKVSTVRGLRDRRVRLSVQTAIQLYDLQDRLGLSQPSKVVDWLLDAARHEIDKLPPLNFPPNFPQVGNISSWGNIPHDHVSQRNSSTCSTTLSKEDYQHRNDVDAKEGCDGGRGGDRWNSTALVSYRQLGAADDVLPSSSSSTVTAAFQVMPGSYALQPSVRGDDPSYLCYNHRLAVAANPSQMSLLPVLGGITKSQTTSAAPTAVLFCTPGTITMPPSLIQAYATSASAHDSKLLDHFHSVCASTATEGTSPIAAPQSYLPSTNLDSFPAEAVAAAPSLIGRLFP